MIVKLGGIALFFFILALLQVSVLPYISIIAITPNLVFILFFILIFFEKPDEYYQGIFVVLLAGFFLDVISLHYFGVSIIALLLIYFLKRMIFYFLKEMQYEYLIFYFILFFTTAFLLYNFILYTLSTGLHVAFNLELSIIVDLLYNLIFACIGFYIQKYFVDKALKDNQLKRIVN